MAEVDLVVWLKALDVPEAPAEAMLAIFYTDLRAIIAALERAERLEKVQERAEAAREALEDGRPDVALSILRMSDPFA